MATSLRKIAAALIAAWAVVWAVPVAVAEESGSFELLNSFVHDYTVLEHAGEFITGGPPDGTATVIEGGGVRLRMAPTTGSAAWYTEKDPMPASISRRHARTPTARETSGLPWQPDVRATRRWAGVDTGFDASWAAWASTPA